LQLWLLQELEAGSHPQPKRASQYQAALLHALVKDQGVRDDYLNFYECMGRLLTGEQRMRLMEYYSYHAPVCVLPQKQLAGHASMTWQALLPAYRLQ